MAEMPFPKLQIERKQERGNLSLSPAKIATTNPNNSPKLKTLTITNFHSNSNLKSEQIGEVKLRIISNEILKSV